MSSIENENTTLRPIKGQAGTIGGVSTSHCYFGPPKRQYGNTSEPVLLKLDREQKEIFKVAVLGPVIVIPSRGQEETTGGISTIEDR